MNVVRLQQLSAYLRTFPPEKFNLRGFAQRGTMCTMCVAALMPEFKLLGYRLVLRAICMDRDTGDVFVVEVPQFGELQTIDAFCAFFDVRYEDVLHILGYDRYEGRPLENLVVTPSLIADHIDRLIAVGSPERRLLEVGTFDWTAVAAVVGDYQLYDSSSEVPVVEEEEACT